MTTSGISQARRQTHAGDTGCKGVCPRLRDSQGVGQTDAGTNIRGTAIQSSSRVGDTGKKGRGRLHLSSPRARGRLTLRSRGGKATRPPRRCPERPPSIVPFPPGAHLHVPEQLEDLHGAVHDVLYRLLPDAAQRGRVDLARGLLRLRAAEGPGRHACGRQRWGGHGTRPLGPAGADSADFKPAAPLPPRRDAGVLPEDVGTSRHAKPIAIGLRA